MRYKKDKKIDFVRTVREGERNKMCRCRATTSMQDEEKGERKESEQIEGSERRERGRQKDARERRRRKTK